MKFEDTDSLIDAGFEGFISISELSMTKCKSIPSDKGVYLVVKPDGGTKNFLEKSSAGKVDRSVSVEILEQRWTEVSIVLYIGKAGGTNPDGTEMKANLKSRIRQLLGYGRGKANNHKGGRYIWQVQDNNELIICWKKTPDEEPRDVEIKLIQEFNEEYGKRPFANLID